MIMVFNLFLNNSGDNLLMRSETNFTRGHDFKLYKITPNCNMRKFAFSQRVVSLWNNLDANTVNAPNLISFKKLLDMNLVNSHYTTGP